MEMNQDHPHPLRKQKIFYGYWIVAVAFLCATVHAGCGFYAFSLFITPIEAEFGWARGKIMVGLTLFFFCSGLSAPLVGRLVDRFGSKTVMTVGATVTGIGFVLVGIMNSLSFFYAAYIIVGFGMAATGMVPATAVISNWFQKKRGTAVGIMSAGIGAGGVVLPPLIAFILTDYGWRVGIFALAVLSWSLIPCFRVCSPHQTRRYGALSRRPSFARNRCGKKIGRRILSGSDCQRGPWYPYVLASGDFILMPRGSVRWGTLQTQIPHLEDIGYPRTEAAGAFAVVGFFSLIGKFFFGWLCDRLPPKYVCVMGLGVQVVGIIILMNVSQEAHPALLWIYAMVIGLGVGSWLPSMSMLVSTNFGLAAYGTLFGMIAFMQSLGASTGPLMSGYIHDMTGAYRLAFVIFLSLYAISAPAVLATRRPKPPAARA